MSLTVSNGSHVFCSNLTTEPRLSMFIKKKWTVDENILLYFQVVMMSIFVKLARKLAHFREKEHNKSFYQLCRHMEPQYHQYEFDLRMYLTHLDLHGELYK